MVAFSMSVVDIAAMVGTLAFMAGLGIGAVIGYCKS